MNDKELRDAFALMAMKMIGKYPDTVNLSSTDNPNFFKYCVFIGRASYQIADQMMKARSEA